jgi:hypothetical protein
VSQSRSETDSAARAATLCAAALIAQQVGAKATRDAMFLSSFGVEALPTMLVASALVSIVFVVATTRVMSASSPGRLVPIAFAVSGALLVGEAVLAASSPGAAAVAVYLHLASFGSVLVSGFWSLVSERFDPHTAKQRISRIAGAGTIGGLLGGVAAERIAALFGVASMLPLLACLHFACAFWVRRMGPTPASVRGDASGDPQRLTPAFRVVAGNPFLRSLAGLVLLGSIAGALVDYLLKIQVVGVYGSGVPLMRFFAAFYTGTGLLAFLVQISLGRTSLERLGVARTVAVLPLAVLAGGSCSLLAPGLISAAMMRGAESVARGSLYRLGYELLFAPLEPGQKRATKTVLDVGLDRLGDAVGGGLLRFALFLSPQAGLTVMTGMLLAVGLASLFIVRGVGRGYRHALKTSMLSRAAAVGAGVPAPVLGAADTLDTGLFLLTLGAQAPAQPSRVMQPAPTPVGGGLRAVDPVVERLRTLRSGDPPAVRRALTEGALLPALVPQAISLLGWDEVYDDAVRALARTAPRIVGQLADSLLDPDEEFAIRRRIPRVLAEARNQRAVEALARGLDDKRFEVRFGCGRALARALAGNPELRIAEEQVYAAVLREAAADRSVWESRRLLDTTLEPEAHSDLDDFVRARDSRSLEHVFRVLSLALPGEPLRVAFRGLHTEDELLRGTALEYLESVLPAKVRDILWPFLDSGDRSRLPPSRSRGELLEALMQSHSSIELRLATLRDKARVEG